VLKMGWNDIGDEGITVIARALHKSKIRKLDVQCCDFTDTGVKELAKGLSLNSSITVLDVWSKRITMEGYRQILKAAVENGVCEEVDSPNSEDNEIQKMMNILETRHKVGTKLNIVWYNCCNYTRQREITPQDPLNVYYCDCGFTLIMTSLYISVSNVM